MFDNENEFTNSFNNSDNENQNIPDEVINEAPINEDVTEEFTQGSIKNDASLEAEYSFQAVKEEGISPDTAEAVQDSAEDNTEAGYTESEPQEKVNSGYSYYNMNTAGQNGSAYSQCKSAGGRKKEKRKKSTAAKIALVLVVALVAGLVAGTAFCGVNYILSNTILDDSATITTTIEDSDYVYDEEQDEYVYSPNSSSVSTTTTTSDTMTVQEVAAECLPSVVTIAGITTQEMSSFFGGTQVYESETAGTGVIIGSNDTELLIATNHHVVSDSTSLSVGFIDETTAEAQIKGVDSTNDLAVISVSLDDISDDTMSQIKIAVIGDSDELELGEQVVAIGNALGYGQSVTSGVISAKDRSLSLSDGSTVYEATGLLQTDAAINSGNSGGPLFNMKGELVGINEAKGSSTSSGVSVEGMGFAIPISKAEPILEELMSLETRTKVDDNSKGYLGITCANVTSDVAEMYNMPIGVCITEVIDGSPAQSGGLLKGDVITAIEGYEVETYDDLTSELEYYCSGESVTITVMRANSGEYVEAEISVVLGNSSVLENYYSQE